MLCELQYTAAPRGLMVGASGFCTVKATHGLPEVLRQALESLSNYRAVPGTDDTSGERNPIGLSFVTIQGGTTRWNVLSRITVAPVSFSRRSNFFAHHIALPSHEWAGLDPAWLASHPDLFAPAWDGRVEEVPARTLPRGMEISRVCERWAAATGDAGWAGVVAQHVQDRKGAYIVFQPGKPVLPLIGEVFSLLPADARSRNTFSTYYCGLPAQVECALRCVVAGSPEHDAARRSSSLVVDLSVRQPARPESAWVARARTGQSDQPVPAVASLAAASSEGNFTPPNAWDRDYALVPVGPPGMAAAVAPLPKRAPSVAPAALASLMAQTPPPDRGVGWWAALAALVVGIGLGVAVIVPFLLMANRQLEGRTNELADANATIENAANVKKSDDVRFSGLQAQFQQAKSDYKANELQFDEQIKKLGRDLEQKMLEYKELQTTSEMEIGDLKRERDNAKKRTMELETLDKQKADEIKRLKNDLAKPASDAPSEAGKPPDMAPKWKIRIPILPHVGASSINKDAVDLVELKWQVQSLELHGKLPKLSLQKKADANNQWQIEHDGTPVGEFIAVSTKLRFRWIASERTTVPRLKDALKALVFASVIAKGPMDSQRVIELGEEVEVTEPEPMPNSSEKKT